MAQAKAQSTANKKDEREAKRERLDEMLTNFRGLVDDIVHGDTRLADRALEKIEEASMLIKKKLFSEDK